MTRKAVVIGGGVAGMSSAIFLSRLGFRVTLVEKGPRVAPLVRGFSRRGMHFDTGFHHSGFLGPGEALDRYFTYMNVRGLKLRALKDSDFEFRFGDTGLSFPLPTGLESIVRTLTDMFPQEAPGIRHYIHAVRSAQDNSPYLNLDCPVGGMGSAPIQTTLRAYLDDTFQNATLPSLLCTQTLLHGVAPHDVDFTFHARVGCSYMRSLHAINGGGKALVEAFESALDSHDVHLLTGRAATDILRSASGAFTGLRLDDGEELTAEACVSTVHPRLLPALVASGAFRPGYVRRLHNRPETQSIRMLFAQANGLDGALSGRTITALASSDPANWFNPRPGHDVEVVSAIFAPKSPGGDPARVEILSPTPSTHMHRSEGSVEGVPVDAILKALERAIPETAGTLELLDQAGPEAFAQWANSPTGSCYGPMHTAHSPSLLPLTKIRGLVLAGQAVVAPGVLGAVISACLAVECLTGPGVLRGEIRVC